MIHLITTKHNIYYAMTISNNKLANSRGDDSKAFTKREHVKN
jgi:hypothetical protein